MPDAGDWIRLRGARTHNLYNVDVDLPRGQLTVITGPSGSGKSSLAFDTLHAESQRRWLATLRHGARGLFAQLPRPDLDSLDGLPPTVCIAQRGGLPRPRSTLATITEIHDHLRLLWARLGTLHCWQCGRAVHKHTIAEIVRATLASGEGRKIFLLAPLVEQQPGKHVEAFQLIRQSGYLRARVDGVLFEIRDNPALDPAQPHTIEMVVDRLVVRPGLDERFTESIAQTAKLGSGRVIVTDLDSGDWNDQAYSTQLICPVCRIAFADPEPRRLSFNSPYGACSTCTGFGQVHAALVAAESEDEPANATADATLDALEEFVPCPECGGARLNREARSVRFAERGLHEVTALTVAAAWDWFDAIAVGQPFTPGFSPQKRERGGADEGWPLTPNPSPHKGERGAGTDSPSPHEGERGEDSSRGMSGANPAGPAQRVLATLLPEILPRLRFLRDIGLGYLTLDRPALTLSGGELQRARLATQLGGGLIGVCYILDEPTQGLHPRDTARLIDALRGLQTRGNTVVVVEHDEAVIRDADWLIDIGPGAGRAGGRLLAAGPAHEVLANPQSVTGRALRSPLPLMGRGVGGEGPSPRDGDMHASSALRIRGARHHNLRNLDVAIPLRKLVALTGVSGSGKSTLARDILCWAARRHLGLQAPTPGAHDAIDGLDQLDQIIEVDQRPLGRGPRSNPATYTGLFDELRKVFATTRTAKLRGYKPNRFSFNVRGGRCEECQGHGERRLAATFLPELAVPCPVCRGKRFNAATLAVLYRGKSIADVLDMTIAEALAFFVNLSKLHRLLTPLADVGLGYLKLGQPSNTLSGGEAQRVKLATELGRTSTGRTLYLLDEPTTGLHVTDVANLIGVLRKLVEAGGSVLVIEHHLDVIAAADWMIDLGPDAGAAGGELVYAGPPSGAAACPASITGRFLDAAV